MLATILIAVNLLVVIALIITILLQRSEGGALGAGSGGSSGGGFFSGRGQANALTRATAVLGALYFATTLILGIVLGASSSDK